ncbi:PaaI family thioesterase [Maricaulis sp.]|uniref:PaaI family thioesterase n=1 Tax=Maricaulis sp. TaxID=1486257 RepID=UPI0025F43470|nr:PaaI family thioesterase [Maricaulis sp.]MDF1768280.1 PaaI family thioesterase [Maricaulis sp.]
MSERAHLLAPDLAGGPPPEPLSDDEIRDRLGLRGSRPTVSTLLGFELIDFSVEERWIDARFNPTPQLANLRGSVQGGIITAMMDEVMSLSVLVAERFTCGVPTLEIKTSYFDPLPVEPCRARGQATRIGGRVAFMEGTIWTPSGSIAARTSATCQVRRVKPATQS